MMSFPILGIRVRLVK